MCSFSKMVDRVTSLTAHQPTDPFRYLNNYQTLELLEGDLVFLERLIGSACNSVTVDWSQTVYSTNTDGLSQQRAKRLLLKAGL